MSVQEIVNKVTGVVSLPTFLTELDKAMDDPNSSLDRVAQIISRDIGLSVRLLKLVNSALYAFPSPIETISRAISIVGTKQLRDLAFTTVVLGMFKIKDPVVNIAQFWRHSIACAVMAKAIATYRRNPDVERFFLLGMLHDIGRLILFSEYPEKMDQVMTLARENKQVLTEVEQTVFGYDHAQVGHALLKAWKLPNAHQEIILYHHTPEKAFRYPHETAIIHLSDLIVTALRFGSSGERYVYPMSDLVDKELTLTPEVLESIIGHAEQEYLSVVNLFLQDV